MNEWKNKFDKQFLNVTMRRDYYDDVKEFIQLTIEEAVKKERNEIINFINNDMADWESMNVLSLEAVVDYIEKRKRVSQSK